MDLAYMGDIMVQVGREVLGHEHGWYGSVQLIGSEHNQDNKENEAWDIWFGDVETQQQTIDVHHHQKCKARW